MEFGRLAGRRGEQFGRQLTTLLKAIEELTLVEFPHADHVFERLSLTPDHRLIRGAGDR